MPFDDSLLYQEVLRLTLAYQRQETTEEEVARLERLLSDNPKACFCYFQIVGDGLTIEDAAQARERRSDQTQSKVVPGADECDLTSPGWARWLCGNERRLQVMWAVAGVVLVAATLVLFPQRTVRNPVEQVAASQPKNSALVIRTDAVEWADPSTAYHEWDSVVPGQVLKFQSGIVSLFFHNGVELSIEGPADVRYDTPNSVFAAKGKLAARVGPEAHGFEINTPHAKVIDRGTSFGVTVDEERQTDVVVYEGTVDLGTHASVTSPPLRRLFTGEGLRVNSRGEMSRITTVLNTHFLTPLPSRIRSDEATSLITSVSDNMQSVDTTKYYRIIPKGFREDCQAYVDRQHEWNGIDDRGLPNFLVGGDYVMTFNDDKIATDMRIAVTLSQPANLYILVDERVSPPEWLQQSFVNTNWKVGADEGYLDRTDIVLGIGKGNRIDRHYFVWRKKVPAAGTVVLGPLSREESTLPARDVERSMYGIVATPLEPTI